MSSYKKFLFMVLPGPKSSFHGIPLHGILLHGIPIHEIPLCGILVHEIPSFHVFLKRKFKDTMGGNLISLYTVWQLCMEPLTAPEV